MRGRISGELTIKDGNNKVTVIRIPDNYYASYEVRTFVRNLSKQIKQALK